jgi:hypothetical protein
VLHGLACEPEILNTVAVQATGSADLGSQAAEDITRHCIYDEERFASNPMKCGETPLADSRLPRNLSSEPEFGDGDW